MDQNKRQIICRLFPEINLVTDKELAEKAVAVWVRFWEHSRWERIEDVPFNDQGLPLKLVSHTRSVIRGAIALADILKEEQKTKVDTDLLILACFLHDVSKIAEYDSHDKNGNAVKSEAGRLYQHAFLGAAMALEAGFPPKLVSIILLHTDQSNRQSDAVECTLLKCADTASMKAALLQ